MKINVYVGDIANILASKDKQGIYLDELSSYRREKALKFKNEVGRALSIGAGTVLKKALAKYSIDEKKAKYSLLKNGKPYLPDYPDIHFNLSHSHDRVMCICTKGMRVGCDVEMVKGGKLKVAERFFTEYEKKRLRSLKDEQGADGGEAENKNADELFFRLWTLKESFIKCTGEGLERAIDSFGFFEEDGEYRLFFANPGSCDEDLCKEADERYRFSVIPDPFDWNSQEMKDEKSLIFHPSGVCGKHTDLGTAHLRHAAKYVYSVCCELNEEICKEDVEFLVHMVEL